MPQTWQACDASEQNLAGPGWGCFAALAAGRS